MKRHWPIILAVILAAIALRQTSSLQAHRAEANTLVTKLNSLDADSDSQPGIDAETVTLSPIKLQQLERSAERMHQFRGDVTMARKEHEQIAAVVEKLVKQFEARSNQLALARAPVFPAGYQQGSALGNVGQASPEATVETFFHANIAGDIDLAIPCFDDLADQKNLDDAAKQQMTDQLKQMFARFPGYQLVTREQLTPTRARLGIRTAPEAQTIHIVLDLTDRQWVINAKESDLFK
jgi:hypothetical protein